MFKTRKKSTKNHIGSCYYAMLLIKFFSVQIHSWKIQINSGSVVYSRTSDSLTFTLSNFLMGIVFRSATLSKRDSNTGVFVWILPIILKTPTLKNIWQCLLMNIGLSIILEFTTTSSFQHFNNKIRTSL